MEWEDAECYEFHHIRSLVPSDTLCAGSRKVCGHLVGEEKSLRGIGGRDSDRCISALTGFSGNGRVLLGICCAQCVCSNDYRIFSDYDCCIILSGMGTLWLFLWEIETLQSA